MRKLDLSTEAGLDDAPVADGRAGGVSRALQLPPTYPLSVVIVNFCQWRNTARLVRQLRHSDAVRGNTAGIVIVDNHSPPHPKQTRLASLRNVWVVHNPCNLGFARAVNRGCDETTGEWVLLLNPDVTVDDGFLDDVQKFIDNHAGEPNLGVVGFQLRNSNGTRQASAGPLPTFAQTVLGFLRPRCRRKCRHQNLTERGHVDWVTGGCLLVRRKCLQELGGFDERFFLYYEDVDFCQRARERGWSIGYEPTLSVMHHSPLHSRTVPAPLRLITRHALLTYARQHWPSWQTQLLARFVEWEARLRATRAPREESAIWNAMRRLPREILRDRHDVIAERIRLAADQLGRIAAAQDRADG